jgi:NADH-quinone oxidoreductase subunit J
MCFFEIIQSINFVASCGLLICFLLLGVVFSSGRVYSVIVLIFGYLIVAAQMLLLGCDFVGLMLILVYVGALSVFFLFIVMTVGDSVERKGVVADLLMSLFLLTLVVLGVSCFLKQGGVSSMDFGIFERGHVSTDFFSVLSFKSPGVLWAPSFIGVTRLGFLLYIWDIVCLMGVGLVLFVAIVGSLAIVLIVSRKPRKREDSTQQLNKRWVCHDSVEGNGLVRGLGLVILSPLGFMEHISNINSSIELPDIVILLFLILLFTFCVFFVFMVCFGGIKQQSKVKICLFFFLFFIFLGFLLYFEHFMVFFFLDLGDNFLFLADPSVVGGNSEKPDRLLGSATSGQPVVGDKKQEESDWDDVYLIACVAFGGAILQCLYVVFIADYGGWNDGFYGNGRLW